MRDSPSDSQVNLAINLQPLIKSIYTLDCWSSYSCPCHVFVVYIYNQDSPVYVARSVVWPLPHKVSFPRLIDFSKWCPVSCWLQHYSYLGWSWGSHNVSHDSIPWSCSLVDVCDLGFDVTFLGCGRWNFKLLGFLDSAFSSAVVFVFFDTLPTPQV